MSLQVNIQVKEGNKMDITKNVANYVRENHISFTKLSNDTGIPYRCLYYSLGKGGERELRVGEFFKICEVLEVNPLDFAD